MGWEIGVLVGMGPVVAVGDRTEVLVGTKIDACPESASVTGSGAGVGMGDVALKDSGSGE